MEFYFGQDVRLERRMTDHDYKFSKARSRDQMALSWKVLFSIIFVRPFHSLETFNVLTFYSSLW